MLTIIQINILNRLTHSKNNSSQFEPMIYDSDEEEDNQEEQLEQPQEQSASHQHSAQNKSQSLTNNQFYLTDQQKININKRLPRGFMLARTKDIEENKVALKLDQNNKQIQFIPKKRQIRIASEELSKQFILQPAIISAIPNQIFGGDTDNQLGATNLIRRDNLSKKYNEVSSLVADKSGLRFSQLPEGKSKQSQKIKNILQRFRKHNKYPFLSQHLQKIGFNQCMLEIEAENKKNIHTIDSFKERMMFVFNQTKAVTYEEGTINLINEMIDEFSFHVEQARKLEFENNLLAIQKAIDKVTREISDIRQSSTFYYRRKKKNEKNYQEKEIMYIAELVKSLPTAYLIGVWEIIQEKSFHQISSERPYSTNHLPENLNSFNIDPNQLIVDFSTLKMKKIREIDFYVKKKLGTYYKSREKKREKLQKKRKIKEKQEELEQKEKELQILKHQKQQVKLEQIKNDDFLFGQEQSAQKSKKIMKENDFLDSNQNIFDLMDPLVVVNEGKSIELDLEQKSMMFGREAEDDFEDEFLKEFGMNDEENNEIEEENQFGNIDQRLGRNLDDEKRQPVLNQNNLPNPLQPSEATDRNFSKESPEVEFLPFSIELGMPLEILGNDEYDSSDSSMITDEEDSQF